MTSASASRRDGSRGERGEDALLAAQVLGARTHCEARRRQDGRHRRPGAEAVHEVAAGAHRAPAVVVGCGERDEEGERSDERGRGEVGGEAHLDGAAGGSREKAKARSERREEKMEQEAESRAWPRPASAAATASRRSSTPRRTGAAGRQWTARTPQRDDHAGGDRGNEVLAPSAESTTALEPPPPPLPRHLPSVLTRRCSSTAAARILLPTTIPCS